MLKVTKTVVFELFCYSVKEMGPSIFSRHLIQEMTTHRESYTKIYENKENFDTIHNALVPCLSGPTPFYKWIRFLEM